jgi:hypothetical protein
VNYIGKHIGEWHNVAERLLVQLGTPHPSSFVWREVGSMRSKTKKDLPSGNSLGTEKAVGRSCRRQLWFLRLYNKVETQLKAVFLDVCGCQAN